MNSFYARLDKENRVTNVIEVSVEDEKPKGLSKLFFWKDEEYWGIKFCQNLVNDPESKWRKGYQAFDIQNRKRLHLPSIGGHYDDENDVFYEEQPYPSFTLDKKTWEWVSPVPRPDTPHLWNEEEQRWDPLYKD